MNGNINGSWSLRLGRWSDSEIRVHLLLPLLFLASLLAAHRGDFPERLALLGNVTLLASVAIHEAVRTIVARRLGGRMESVVLAPTGGWSQPVLPADPPAHLLAALAGPLVYLTLCVLGGCVLTTLGGGQLVQLLSPLAPQFDLEASSWKMAAELAVWINSTLLLANLVPVGHSDGAALLKSIIWPLVDRKSASTALGHLALGASLATGVLALWLKDMTFGPALPAWFALGLLSLILLYGSEQLRSEPPEDAAREIEELDSDDSQWLEADWHDDDEAAVVVIEPLHEKQQETIDRKRREREDLEDAEVDHILERLHQVSYAGLSEEERAVLKRASRRYRQRLNKSDHAS